MAVKEPSAGRYFDRFDLLFLVTIATVGLLLLVDVDQAVGLSAYLALTVTGLTAATLLLAVLAAGIRRRGLQFTWLAIGVTVGASIVALLIPQSAGGHGGLLWLVLVVAAPFIALRRLVRHDRVTGATVLGAVSVYLLMAIAGAYLFLFIDSVGGDPGRFFGEPQPTTVFMYFSLVTITTLGYGDFAPAEVFGRAAAGWLAVTGQIYLVVVVARMVALFGGVSRPGIGSDPDAGDKESATSQDAR